MTEEQYPTCANDECKRKFKRKTHNQKYCEDECTRIATNKRIMEKYYEKREISSGAKRVCSNPSCSTVLSRYNFDDVCSPCATARNKDISEMISRLS